MSSLSQKFFIFIGGLLLLCNVVFSQDDQIPVRDEQVKKANVEIAHKVDLGAGFGLDYGGIGVQAGFTALKHLTFFASGGYYSIQAGWNVGIKALLISKTSKHVFRPFLKGMYGCNSVILVEGADQYNKVYNGWTIGIGMELRFGKMKQAGFDIDINVPLRTPDFWTDWQTVKNIPGIDIYADPVPIAPSIGFHFEL